jgi:hypothetical protein
MALNGGITLKYMKVSGHSYKALFGTVLRATRKTYEFPGRNSNDTRAVTRGSIIKCDGQFICFKLLVGSPIRFAMSKQIFLMGCKRV